MIAAIVILGIIFAVAGALISGKYIIFPISVAAGCTVAVLLLLHMKKCASTIIELPAKRAKVFGRNMSLLRKLLMVAALGLAYYYREYVDPWGVLLGLFSLKIAAYVHGFIKIDFGRKREEINNAGSVSTGNQS